MCVWHPWQVVRCCICLHPQVCVRPRWRQRLLSSHHLCCEVHNTDTRKKLNDARILERILGVRLILFSLLLSVCVEIRWRRVFSEDFFFLSAAPHYQESKQAWARLSSSTDFNDISPQKLGNTVCPINCTVLYCVLSYRWSEKSQAWSSTLRYLPSIGPACGQPARQGGTSLVASYSYSIDAWPMKAPTWTQLPSEQRRHQWPPEIVTGGVLARTIRQCALPTTSCFATFDRNRHQLLANFATPALAQLLSTPYIFVFTSNSFNGV